MNLLILLPRGGLLRIRTLQPLISSSSSTRLYVSTRNQGELCSDLGRVLALTDPSSWGSENTTHKTRVLDVNYNSSNMELVSPQPLSPPPVSATAVPRSTLPPLSPFPSPQPSMPTLSQCPHLSPPAGRHRCCTAVGNSEVVPQSRRGAEGGYERGRVQRSCSVSHQPSSQVFLTSERERNTAAFCHATALTRP